MEPYLQAIDIINASHYTDAEKTALIVSVSRGVTDQALNEVRALVSRRVPAEALRLRLDALRPRRTIKVMRG